MSLGVAVVLPRIRAHIMACTGIPQSPSARTWSKGIFDEGVKEGQVELTEVIR